MRISNLSIVVLAVPVLSVVSAQSPTHRMAVYVLDFQTNLKGEYAIVAHDTSVAVDTAFTKRSEAFHVLERANLNVLVQQNKMEKDLQALVSGQRPSQRFLDQVEGANGFVRGEFLTRPDGVTLTVSLIRLDSEKVWQGQRRHSLYEWMNGDLQQKEAEALAAEAAAAVLPPLALKNDTEDLTEGLHLAAQGHCAEAIPYLQNAARVETENAELLFQLGRCQNLARNYAEALQSLSAALRRKPRADIFVERALVLSGQGLNARALEDLDQALRLDSRNLAAVELRGDIWMQMGRYDDAVLAFYEVEQQRPSRARCRKLAEAYRKNGVPASAESTERSCASL